MKIAGYSITELQEWMASHGEPTYRAKQVYDWIHAKQVASVEEMTNLPLSTRALLKEEGALSPQVLRRQVSSDGTEKYLFGFEDGNAVETVAMEYEHGLSVCISTQVGCRMGCAFCASTVNGLVRSLSAGEMLAQIYGTHRLKGERVDSIVLMGIGEPLDNLEEVLRFYDRITDEKGYALRNRAVTISTCGLVPQMRQLAQLKKQLNLSISLHSADSARRDTIMPINHRYPLPELLEACREYVEQTGRRITFEYTVIDGFNNRPEDEVLLEQIARSMVCHFNLIPVNSAGRGDFHATRKQTETFAKRLQERGINATVRRTLGNDISAACGQLRRETNEAVQMEKG